MKYILIFFLIIYSCKEKARESKEYKNSINNTTINSKNLILAKEDVDKDFLSFFEKFKKDKVFQNQRIRNPIIFNTFDDDNVSYSEKKHINFVSFDQSDWDVEITYEIRSVDSVTKNVILEGLDTGVQIEHIFKKDLEGWHLIEINNLSQ